MIELLWTERIIAFFHDNLPGRQGWLLGGPPALAWSYACLRLAGHLKLRRGWRTGYTRKTFHFLIFSTVAVLQAVWGTPAVCLFGSMTSLVVFYAVLRGNGSPLYEAMAREKDAPHRTYYILAPYFATLLGGLASNILFGPAAIAGYLACGCGDAIAEPVGTRWGRHRYRVPAAFGVATERSLEGSAAIFLACLAAGGASLSLSTALDGGGALSVLIFATACVLIEAVSPHGWDNATMQILPSWLAVLLWQS